MIEHISCRETLDLVQAGQQIVLLDVREQWEYELSHIPDCTFIPLRELQHRYTSLPKDRQIVIYCHHGSRSFLAAAFLLQKGFTKIKNLDGGIDAFASVDPSILRY